MRTFDHRRLIPFLGEQHDHGQSLEGVEPQACSKIRLRINGIFNHIAAQDRSFTFASSGSAHALTKTGNGRGVPIWATLLTAPISMPSSNVLVQTAVAG